MMTEARPDSAPVRHGENNARSTELAIGPARGEETVYAAKAPAAMSSLRDFTRTRWSAA